jgi:Kef-type K+ transport system membrane component KefB
MGVAMVSDSPPIEGLDYGNLLIVMAAATFAPLVLDVSPLPAIPPIVIDILAGILIGPQVLDIVSVDAPLEVFSQVGLVFLFFLAGLEIAFHAHGERHLGAVAAAFGVSLVLAALVAVGFDAAGIAETPILVAIILAATSFGIVVAVLKDAGLTGTPFGQLVIAAASIADFSTVVLLSLFFSSSGASFENTLVLLVLFFALVVVVGLVLLGARASGALRQAIVRMQRTSAQISVRIAFLLLAVLVFFAGRFGLEVVLGAFLGGAMVSLLDRERAVTKTGLQEKLEGIGFGIFIPTFFVVSGVTLDLDALFSSFDTMVLVPLTVVALLLIRGAPVALYRRFLSGRMTVAAGLLQATSLSFIVPATQIGVELGKISTATAAGLVAGGVVTVLVFPAVALRLMTGGQPA